jgi:hypothetical protein
MSFPLNWWWTISMQYPGIRLERLKKLRIISEQLAARPKLEAPAPKIHDHSITTIQNYSMSLHFIMSGKVPMTSKGERFTWYLHFSPLNSFVLVHYVRQNL